MADDGSGMRSITNRWRWMKTRTRQAIPTVGIVCLLAGLAQATPSLVDLAGGSAIGDLAAQAISSDGSTIVGRGLAGSSQVAFRWTRSGGVETLEGLSALAPAGAHESAEGVSGDGRLIVGSIGTQAFVWDRAGGVTRLEPLPGSTAGAVATAISDDGRHVVGRSHTGAFGTGPPGSNPQDPPFFAPVAWLDPTTPVNIMNFLGTATGVSNDGVVVGSLTDDRPQGETSGFRVDLGRPTPQFVPGFGTAGNEALALAAAAISTDGSTIVGPTLATPRIGMAIGQIGYLWSGDTGTTNILDAAGLESILPSQFGSSGGLNVHVRDVSADGSAVVGALESLASGERVAFVWTRRGGVQDLAVLLGALGLDTSDWDLEDAIGLSGDGRTITGLGQLRAGDGTPRRTSFVAVIPEPSIALLLGLGLGLFSTHARPGLSRPRR